MSSHVLKSGLAISILIASASHGQVAGEDPKLGFGNRVHMMPMLEGPGVDAPGAHLNYYGGRVIPNVGVVAVFWGPNVDPTVRSQIGGFFTAVTNSPYIDWLSEYNTNITAFDGQPGTNQFIGRGSLAATITINPFNTGTLLQDTAVQSEINSQINAGNLPVPDANTLFMVYFPPGIRIVQGGQVSCQQFCAYHGTFTRSGSSVFYGVMPDFGPGSGCDFGCGSNPSAFNNLTSVSSHELIEAITDADVGLASVIGRPLAWYDPANGEIGDICNAQQGSISGYVVQKEWSNQAGACIVTRTVADDFTMALNPTTRSTGLGTSTSYAVNTTLTSGGPQTVNLSLSNLPASITGSFSPNPITSGGSSTLTVTVAADASPATYSLTVTGAGTSATRSAGGTLIVLGGGGDGLVNGDFERGDLSGWSAIGSASAVTVPHSGSYSALVGSTSPSSDSALVQTFNMPSSATTLSLWYAVNCPDTVQYDWAEATIRDNVTSTTVTIVPRTCPFSYAWTAASVNIAAMAGHSVTLTLSNHDDGYPGDPTYTLYDDVVVQ